MAAGEPVGLLPRQQERIEQAIEKVRAENGLDVSVLVGDLDLADITQFRAGAERLHAALGTRSPASVLIVVAPGQRRVEVGAIFRSHRRHRKVGIGQADTLAVGHPAADHHAGDRAVR